MQKTKKKVWILALMLTLIYIGISYQEVASQTKERVETFYKGKTIRFLVPFAPEGLSTFGLGLWPHIWKNIAGQKCLWRISRGQEVWLVVLSSIHLQNQMA